MKKQTKYSLQFKLTSAFQSFTLLLFSLLGIFVNFLLDLILEKKTFDLSKLRL